MKTRLSLVLNNIEGPENNLLCRLCLSHKNRDELKDIFSPLYNDCHEIIAKIVKNLVPIRIQKNDNFPKTVCPNCLDKLRIVYDFKILIKKSDDTLKIRLERLKSNDLDNTVPCTSTKPLQNEIIVKVEKNDRPQQNSGCGIECKSILNSDCGEIKAEYAPSSESHNNTNHPENNYLKTLEPAVKIEIESDNTLIKCQFENDLTDNVNYVDRDVENECIGSEKDSNSLQSKIVEKEHNQTKQKKMIACSLCDKKFTRKTLLKFHMYKHTGTYPLHFQVCDKGFATKQSLNIHNLIHTGEKPHQCDICGKIFRTSTQLKMHRMAHDSPLPKPFKCQFCDKTFQTQCHRDFHERRHTNDRNFLCEICNKRFVCKGDLRNHQKIYHSDDKPMECSICKKIYPTKHKLKLHMKRHSKKIVVYCEVCKHGFPSKYSLKSHMVTHTGEKPYTCEICNKSFGFDSALLNHRIVHTGEKKHECKYCGQKFKYSQQHSAHVMKVHSNMNLEQSL